MWFITREKIALKEPVLVIFIAVVILNSFALKRLTHYFELRLLF